MSKCKATRKMKKKNWKRKNLKCQQHQHRIQSISRWFCRYCFSDVFHRWQYQSKMCQNCCRCGWGFVSMWHLNNTVDSMDKHHPGTSTAQHIPILIWPKFVSTKNKRKTLIDTRYKPNERKEPAEEINSMTFSTEAM